MLDKTSKSVIAFLGTFPDNTWRNNKGYHFEKLPFEEFLVAVNYLESQDIVEVHRVSGGIVSVSLSHPGRHRQEFSWIAFTDHLKNHWIDLLALIISVWAFIRTF